MGYSLTELGIGARNLSSVAILWTKDVVALELGLRNLQAWPVDLKVLEEPPLTTRCSNKRHFVEPSE